jgi:hypothetical protein
MELGGKNNAIVYKDADLKTALGAVLAASFINVRPQHPKTFGWNLHQCKGYLFHSPGKFVWLQIE